jgi:adenylyltransferase/sulfurtransferase
VIGAVSAMVAQIAVLEGLKLVTRFAEPALDQMIHVDAAKMRMKKVRLVRDPGCEHCGMTEL